MSYKDKMAERKSRRKKIEAYKKKARDRRRHDFWVDFMRFNLTGWSVVIPTLIGVAVGAWIDSRWEGSFSWTLALMFVGLVLGCLNAWYWIRRKDY